VTQAGDLTGLPTVIISQLSDLLHQIVDAHRFIETGEQTGNYASGPRGYSDYPAIRRAAAE
jgi:hypothetical protein